MIAVPRANREGRGEGRLRAWLLVWTTSPAPVPPHGGRSQEQTRWELETLEGLDAHLHLPSIACTVPLAEVYERIVFPQAEGDPTP